MRRLLFLLLAVTAGACTGALAPTTAPTATPSPTVAGTVFNGDGYTIVIPASPALTYSRASGTDMWATDTTPTVAMEVLPVVGLLPGSQSLEGALGRAQQSLAAVQGAGTPTVATVSLPAGGAYRLDVTAPPGPIRMYAFYKNQIAYLVTFINFPDPLSDQVIGSLVFQ